MFQNIWILCFSNATVDCVIPVAANVSWRKQELNAVKGGCCQVSLQAANRNYLVPGYNSGQQHPSALEQHCLWRKALGGCEGWALNLRAGRFICHLAAQFGQHSVGPKAVKLWGKSHREVLQQPESFVAPRARTCCRETQTVKVDQARLRVREEPCWTWLGEAGGTRSSFCPAQHHLCPLPSQGAGLVVIYCPLHTASSDKLCIACALSIDGVWKEPAGRWSFGFEVWVSASLESTLSSKQRLFNLF